MAGKLRTKYQEIIVSHYPLCICTVSAEHEISGQTGLVELTFISVLERCIYRLKWFWLN